MAITTVLPKVFGQFADRSEYFMDGKADSKSLFQQDGSPLEINLEDRYQISNLSMRNRFSAINLTAAKKPSSQSTTLLSPKSTVTRQRALSMYQEIDRGTGLFSQTINKQNLMKEANLYKRSNPPMRYGATSLNMTLSAIPKQKKSIVPLRTRSTTTISALQQYQTIDRGIKVTFQKTDKSSIMNTAQLFQKSSFTRQSSVSMLL